MQPVRVGLWSRVYEGERPAGGGKGYLLRHDVETATTSPAMPVSEEMRATIGRVMEACGISHEPPPATPTAAPDRPALRP